MLIQIETENLIKEKITPNDYIILKLLFDKNYEILKQLFNSDIMSNLIILENEGYLKVTCDELDWSKISTQVTLRQKTIDLFIVKQTGFYEFWSKYPVKVGSRVLKAQDIDSKEALMCRDKWNRITQKNPIKEALIIKGLEIELEIRRKSNQLPYMQLVTTWLNQQTWEKYTHLINEEISDTNEKTVGI